MDLLAPYTTRATATTAANATTTTTATATTVAFPSSAVCFSFSVVGIIRYCCDAHVMKGTLVMILTEQVQFEDPLAGTGLEPKTQKA